MVMVALMVPTRLNRRIAPFAPIGTGTLLAIVWPLAIQSAGTVGAVLPLAGLGTIASQVFAVGAIPVTSTMTALASLGTPAIPATFTSRIAPARSGAFLVPSPVRVSSRRRGERAVNKAPRAAAVRAVVAALSSSSFKSGVAVMVLR